MIEVVVMLLSYELTGPKVNESLFSFLENSDLNPVLEPVAAMYFPTELRSDSPDDITNPSGDLLYE